MLRSFHLEMTRVIGVENMSPSHPVLSCARIAKGLAMVLHYCEGTLQWVCWIGSCLMDCAY